MTSGLFIKGLLLGLGAAAPIGPVNVEIARRTLRQSYRYGVAIGAGAVTVDVTYAVIASLGFAPLVGNRWITYGLGIAGLLLLTYLAAMCFRGAWRSIATRDAGDDADASAGVVARSIRGTYVTGLMMTLLNPMTLAFWFVVLPAVAAKLTDRPTRDLPLLCAGVFAGAFGWTLGFAGILAYAGRFRRGAWVLLADAAGGLVLLGFAGATALWLLRGAPR